MSRLFMVLVVVLFACKGNKPPIPVNTMKYIMFDITVADEYFLNKLGTDTNYKKQNPQPTILYNEVFAKHKLSQKEFYSALSFYQNNPEQMKELLDSTLSLATLNKKYLDSPSLKPKIKK